MGDRANVRVLAESWPTDVYLYTHWTGTELPGIVQSVIAREERWTDPSYLGRMIFSAMVKDHIDAATGYGISSTVGDGDDRIITVDVDRQAVTMPDGRDWTFPEFIRVAGQIDWSDEDGE